MILTGGGTGIGRAAALAFAKAQAKAVVITGRRQSTPKGTMEEVKKFGIELEYIVADVIDKTQMQEVFTKVITSFARIDIYL